MKNIIHLLFSLAFTTVVFGNQSLNKASTILLTSSLIHPGQSEVLLLSQTPLFKGARYDIQCDLMTIGGEDMTAYTSLVTNNLYSSGITFDGLPVLSKQSVPLKTIRQVYKLHNILVTGEDNQSIIIQNQEGKNGLYIYLYSCVADPFIYN